MHKETTTARPQGKPKTKPFSIRLTEDEKTLLLYRAATSRSVPMCGLILSNGEISFQPRRRRTKAPVKDHEGLARILAALGQSRIANNLNQIAKAVNIGVLPVTPETKQDIPVACSPVSAMRRYLLSALGMMDGAQQ